MNILQKTAELFSPSDAELVEKTLARIEEQDKWNDVFSTKLIHVLDNIDGLKSELRQQMRTVEQSSDQVKHDLRDINGLKNELRQQMRDVERSNAQAKQNIQQAQKDLASSHQNMESSLRSLTASQENLDTARGHAEKAQEDHIQAAEVFRRAARLAFITASFSLLLFVWTGWLQFRSTIPMWAAIAASTISVIALRLIASRGTREA